MVVYAAEEHYVEIALGEDARHVVHGHVRAVDRLRAQRLVREHERQVSVRGPALRVEVGRDDSGRTALLGFERPQAVPATDVEDFLAAEIDRIECAHNRRRRRSPHAGRHDAVAEVDRVHPCQRLDVLKEVAVRSDHVAFSSSSRMFASVIGGPGGWRTWAIH
jgi:hypothetical protein